MRKMMPVNLTLTRDHRQATRHADKLPPVRLYHISNVFWQIGLRIPGQRHHDIHKNQFP
jgi:hypothetical protein